MAPDKHEAELAESGQHFDAEKSDLSSGVRTYGSLTITQPALAQHYRLGIPAVCWYILVVEFCERLAFYTFAGSQAFFLEHIGFSLSSAGALNATMWTLCTVLAIFASWTADVGLGRYNTILCAGLLYVVGTAMGALAAWPGRERSGLYFVGMLGFVPLATAGIKANISNFGADQYDTRAPDAKAAQEKFFSIFYCTINVGAGLAYGFFTTFASSGGLGVPKSSGYIVSYAIMSGCMLIACVIFCAGRRGYKVHPLQQQSALASLFHCLWQNVRCGSKQAASVFMGLWMLLAAIILSAFQSLYPSAGHVTMMLAFIVAAVGTLSVVVPCLDPSWLCVGAAGTTSDESDVQGLLRLMPVLFTGSLSFGALYNSMQFWYQQQACQMDVRFGSSQLSGSFFNIADCIAIVAITPIAVYSFNPAAERLTGVKLGTRVKFGIGMLIAGLSVVFAARLEVVRRHARVLPEASNCAPPGVAMSDIPAAWMAGPFFLMGIAEIYTQPTLLHYAYANSPDSMRTLAMAASFFIQAVSSALFALIVSCLSKFMPNDLNQGSLEYGYFVNIAIGIVFYACFLMVVKTEQ